MKKFIIISLIITLILGLSIFESTFSYNTYGDIISYCKQLEIALTADNDKISKDENVLNIYGKIEKKWYSFKGFALAFGNHIQIKDFEQKLCMLKGYILNDDKKESEVSLLALSSAAGFLQREFAITYENIL